MQSWLPSHLSPLDPWSHPPSGTLLSLTASEFRSIGLSDLPSSIVVSSFSPLRALRRVWAFPGWFMICSAQILSAPSTFWSGSFSSFYIFINNYSQSVIYSHSTIKHQFHRNLTNSKNSIIPTVMYFFFSSLLKRTDAASYSAVFSIFDVGYSLIFIFCEPSILESDRS